MRWNKGSSRYYSLSVPGQISIKASITVHSETIAWSITIGGAVVRKECTPVTAGVDSVKKNIEGILNEMALGIWEG